MFKEEDLQALDSEYFSIITKNEHDVTIQSRNTGHWWYLHNTEYPTEGFTLIYHKHRFTHPYHEHGKARTLRQAVRSIKGHDRWQIDGRT